METKAAAEAQEQKPSQAEDKQSPYALFFELEGVATPGRQAAFEVLKSILGEHKLTLEPSLFSRHCLHPVPERYVPELLEALGAKLSAEKLAEDVQSGVVMHLSSSTGTLRPGFGAILDAARARDIPVAALTALPQASAESVAKRLGLDKWDVQIFPAGEEEMDEAYPRSDAWLKIAKSMNKTARRCLVFASEKASCRAALSAGMSCVVFPDEFTAFQDFGGADLVLDALEERVPEELLEELCPADQ